MEAPLLIGQWLIEPQLNKVSGPSGSVTIEPRTMKVLVLLAQKTPDVVTRETLLDVVWEGSVVTEHSLTIAISDLRKLFGDDPKSPAVIETIRGVGYRLIAPVREETPSFFEGTPTLSVPHMGDGLAMQTAPPRLVSRAAIWGAATATLLAIAILGFFLWPRQVGLEIQKIQPLTTMAGVEISPAFSPDSRRVAFVSFPDSGGLSDIFIKQLDGNTPVRFTSEKEAELMPIWSPDGQFIVYLSRGQQGCALYKRPSFGGAGLKLKDISCQVAGMSWVPDGESLVLSLYDAEMRVRRLYTLSLSTLDVEPITTPSSSIFGDFWPRFSPDGRNLAFVKHVDGVTQDVYAIDWDNPEDEPVRLTFDAVQITGLDWTADSEAIVFASAREEQKGLWHMEVNKQQQPTLIRAISVDDPGAVALAPSGKQLIYTDWTYEVNIWRMSMVDDDAPDLQPALVSTRGDFYPHISSMNKIAFISSRSGENEVWVSDLEGTAPMQVTDLKSKSTRFPAWSPDGSQIVFDSHLDGHSDIYVIDAEGGMPVRLTTNESRDVRPTWSEDGQHVYFGSNRSGEWQIWRHSLVNGEVTQVTQEGGIVGWESDEGRSLLHFKPDTSGVWIKSFEDGSEQQLFDADPSFMAVIQDHIYYLHPIRNPSSYTIMKYDLEEGQAVQVAVVPTRPFDFFSRWGFTVSPDEHWIYLSQVDKSESDLMLTE